MIRSSGQHDVGKAGVVTAAILAIAIHFVTPLLFLAGVANLSDGWGRDPVTFLVGLFDLCLCAAFVWTTADAMAVVRKARRAS